MGDRLLMQESLSNGFRLGDHVPLIVSFGALGVWRSAPTPRQRQAGFHGSTGRPSVDPELTIRMLLIGDCSGIRSGRRLCEEIHLNPAYRRFCRLGLEG